MKNKLLLSAALLLMSSAVFGQFTFGVSPGLSFNGAYFGYNTKKNLVPFIGLQFANISLNDNESGMEFDDFGNLTSYDRKFEVKGGIYVPNIGVKYFLVQKNKLKAYTVLNFAKPILKVKPKTGDTELDTEISDAVKKIKLWGGEVGFGTEYFFDDNFSIGGEFGIRHINVKSNDTFTRSITNPDTFETIDVQIKSEVSLGLNPTYSRISLNFYF